LPLILRICPTIAFHCGFEFSHNESF
jgi:hypothetical protein